MTIYSSRNSEARGKWAWFINASHGRALACSEAGVLYALESLTAPNSTEATERSALNGISGSTPPAWPSSSGCGKRGTWIGFMRMRG